jgi:Ca2+:H+ antiporter
MQLHTPTMSELTPLLSHSSGEAIGFGASFVNALKSTWINSLIIFVPLGIAAEYAHWSNELLFVFNFLAVIPLAKLLAIATEELALRTGPAIGSLLNATFGNFTELILAVAALRKGLLRIVLSSLMGSILSNLLLSLGLCFFLGGLKYQEQYFRKTAALTNSSMLTLSALSLLLPKALQFFLANEHDPDRDAKFLLLSREVSLVLIAVYGAYLFFQLRTHSYMFSGVESDERGQGDVVQEHEEEEPMMNVPAAAVLLVAATILVSIVAEYLVGSVEGLVERFHLSQSFVGLILLGVVGTAAEQIAAVGIAMKNKQDLSLGIALGSSLQISLFVTPLLILIGWGIGQPLALNFSGFEIVVVIISTLIVNGIIQDGKSVWLEGLLLLAAYLIVAMSLYFLP